MRGREEGGTVVSNQCIQSETGITSLKGDADVEAGFIILNKTRHCSRYHNCNLTSEGRQIYCDIEVGDRSQFYMHDVCAFLLRFEWDFKFKFISETFCRKIARFTQLFSYQSNMIIAPVCLKYCRV